jgi:lysophospholipase L1-like esterase
VILAVVVTAALVVPPNPDEPRTFTDRLVMKFNAMRQVSVGRAETEGYYEDLFQHSTRAVAVNALVSGNWAAKWNSWEFTNIRRATTTKTGGYLYFELRPNIAVKEFNGRLVTNSFGMADREYSIERRAGFRRVAFIGDSMTRGLGSTPGLNYESLLENALNTKSPNPDLEGYEFLNFGVEGYRLTQMIEVVRTRAAVFAPDAYVLVLTDLSLTRKWADHVWQLVNDGIDLRYDFLKDLVQRANLRVGDDPITVEAKLEPYRAETIRWALTMIRDSALEQGAAVVVLLMPVVSNPAAQQAPFAGVAELTNELGLPTIDLLDTYVGIENLLPYKTSPGDTHPSDLGHQHVFDHLMPRLEQHQRAWEIITGLEDRSGRREPDAHFHIALDAPRPRTDRPTAE